jgi:hypothetical protein
MNELSIDKTAFLRPERLSPRLTGVAGTHKLHYRCLKSE